MKTKSDEELMNLYANEANEDAFEEIYRRYASQLYGFLNRKAGKRVDMDAVFQDTFLKLHQAKENYRPEYPFSAWIFTICRNTLADHYRKIEKFQAAKDHYESELESKMPQREVEIPDAALAHLPANQKRAVELRYLEKLPFEAIAKELEKSEDSVRQLVSRGVRRLRLILEKR